MSFYRYGLGIYVEGNKETIQRSLSPIPLSELQKNDNFAYQYYTSEKDDSPNCHVISMGIHSCTTNHDSTRHSNRFILNYVVSGCGTINDVPIQKGQYFFSLPYESCNLKTGDHSPMTYYYIGLAGKGTEEIIKNAEFPKLERIQNCPFIDQIPEMFRPALFEPHQNIDPDYMLVSLFLQLVAMHKPYNTQKSNQPQDDTFYYYKQALLYVNEYVLRGITPKDVAQYLHISPSYLRAVFSKHCQYSLRELLIRKRLECAATKLAFHQCSVGEAANLIGYDDYIVFSRIFKKYMGVSPQSYKQIHKPPDSDSFIPSDEPVNNSKP